MQTYTYTNHNTGKVKTYKQPTSKRVRSYKAIAQSSRTYRATQRLLVALKK